ncbi:hypothetical protein [Paludisphaera rhizosphaerae]|uniref:hypothetical protein n=1 Tax=Paludisphaera rhizosphaerae TaxID=2711216 RepID=UPI0013EC027E|nr:hypothetical protein [Paludisphaera rhizosphaerae]
MDVAGAREFYRNIRGSLGAAAAILVIDVVFLGSILWSLILCPIWVFVSLVKSANRHRPGYGLVVTRMLIPVATFLLVRANDSFQRGMAEANAQRIIAACEAYQADNGSLPGGLKDLVPKYLSSVPVAKYCLGPWSRFTYFNSKGGTAMLVWHVVPPYYRKIYSFEDRRWSYLD